MNDEGSAGQSLTVSVHACGPPCRRRIMKKATHIGHQPSESDVPGPPWSNVRHARMSYKGCGDGTGPARAGTFCPEPDPLAHLSQTEPNRATGECGTIMYLAIGCGSRGKTNRPPSCTSKPVQRRESGAGARLMKVTVLF